MHGGQAGCLGSGGFGSFVSFRLLAGGLLCLRLWVALGLEVGGFAGAFVESSRLQCYKNEGTQNFLRYIYNWGCSLLN